MPVERRGEDLLEVRHRELRDRLAVARKHRLERLDVRELGLRLHHAPARGRGSTSPACTSAARPTACRPDRTSRCAPRAARIPGCPASVVACTNSTIACFAAPSFQDGRGSVWRGRERQRERQCRREPAPLQRRVSLIEWMGARTKGSGRPSEGAPAQVESGIAYSLGMVVAQLSSPAQDLRRGCSSPDPASAGTPRRTRVPSATAAGRWAGCSSRRCRRSRVRRARRPCPRAVFCSHRPRLSNGSRLMLSTWVQ